MLHSIPLSEEVIIAIISAVSLFAGSFLPKFFDLIYQWFSSKNEINTEFRDSLIMETKELREEIRKINLELDKWKVKYYEIFSEYGKQSIGMERLESEYKELKESHDALDVEYNTAIVKYNKLVDKLNKYLPEYDRVSYYYRLFNRGDNEDGE